MTTIITFKVAHMSVFVPPPRPLPFAAVKGPSRQATPLIRCVALHTEFSACTRHFCLLWLFLLLVSSFLSSTEWSRDISSAICFFFLVGKWLHVCVPFAISLSSNRALCTLSDTNGFFFCFGCCLYFQMISIAGALHGVSFVYCSIGACPTALHYNFWLQPIPQSSTHPPQSGTFIRLPQQLCTVA